MVKVLVAEDDKFLSKAYAAKFKKTGFNTVLALNGQEAIDKIKSEKPDIILLDLIMPKKDGFDVLYEIKQDDTVKNIPVDQAKEKHGKKNQESTCRQSFFQCLKLGNNQSRN